jgi:ferredoxin
VRGFAFRRASRRVTRPSIGVDPHGLVFRPGLLGHLEHESVLVPASPAAHMKITWSANSDADLGGSVDDGDKDVLHKSIADKVTFEFLQTFMFYLPRICEHCLNPSCAASCPSGAIYKRSEDGIVLVDQDKCKGELACDIHSHQPIGRSLGGIETTMGCGGEDVRLYVPGIRPRRVILEANRGSE